MFGLSDLAPIEFPEQKRESLLNFLQGDNDKETRLKVDSAFSKATLYNIEGVFVLDWENGLTEEYTCKNNIWVRVGINNNLYKMKIEQIKKDNQKDAPFYQNMTKTEVVESLVRCIYGGESTAEHFLTKNNVFLYDDIVVIEGLIEGKNKGYQQFCKYNKDGKLWTIEDSNNPKELAPLASEEHQHQKHLMEKEAEKQKDLYLKRLAAAECHPNQLTAQDLIQAAKDELVYRIYGGCCSSVDAKQGFAECIKFMEQILKDQPNVK